MPAGGVTRTSPPPPHAGTPPPTQDWGGLTLGAPKLSPMGSGVRRTWQPAAVPWLRAGRAGRVQAAGNRQQPSLGLLPPGGGFFLPARTAQRGFCCSKNTRRRRPAKMGAAESSGRAGEPGTLTAQGRGRAPLPAPSPTGEAGGQGALSGVLCPPSTSPAPQAAPPARSWVRVGGPSTQASRSPCQDYPHTHCFP